MSINTPITKEKINDYLRELAKEYRRRSGKSIPAEIILVGGAAIMINYGFRDTTYDIDAVIQASSVMKEAANYIGDCLGLQSGWLNMDFRHTKSYSEKLLQYSVYYKTYSNILTIRTVTAEYLIAMKLMSGREYKYDLSDIAGIFYEHSQKGNPISQEDINRAVVELYESWDNIPQTSIVFLESVFASGDYLKVYNEIRENEREAKEILLNFDKEYPNVLTTDNLSDIILAAREKSKVNEREN